MLGAIIGDTVGSRYEWRNHKSKDFELFHRSCRFTDDSACTMAVAETLMKHYPIDYSEEGLDLLKKDLAESFIKYVKTYPDVGYGGSFYRWATEEGDHKPYNSWGNGSAMRVSAAGWLYGSLERTLEVARWTAEVSHNHPEGIKGAQCTAAVIYLARIGTPKEKIKEYVTNEFGYDLHEGVDELRIRHHHDESCMDSLPKALISFFEGDSYEDVVRNAVSLGGDTDTLGAIARAMAEAMYGIPDEILKKGCEFLTDDLLSVLKKIKTMKDE